MCSLQVYSIVIQYFCRLYSIIGCYKIMDKIPCARQYILLLIYFIHSSLLIPYPNLFPFSLLFGNHEFVFYVCESVSVLHIHSFVLLFWSTYNWYHVVFVFLWPISLSMIFSRSINIAANDNISFFLRLSNIPVCVCVCVCAHACVCVHSRIYT